MTFADGLEYQQQDWDYCTLQDRRFFQERVNGFIPGDPQLSNQVGEQGMIPIHTPDHGYCYYSKNDEQIHLFDGNLIRGPTEGEKTWLATQSISS